MDQSKLHHLEQIPLFTGLAPTVIEQINRQISRRRHSFGVGKIFTPDNKQWFGVLCLLRGRIVVELPSASGKVVRMQELSAPEVLAPTFTLSSHTIPVQLRCLTETEMFVLPKPVFYQLLGQEARLMDNFVDMVAARVDRLSRKIIFLQFKTIRRKLIGYLLLLPRVDAPGIQVQLPLSITEMADLFAVERPSVSRVLSELVAEGLVRKLPRRRLEILDHQALVRLAGDDD